MSTGRSHEARIAALFRDAASDAPPAAFDDEVVAATSRRITARRRSAVAGAAVAGWRWPGSAWWPDWVARATRR